MYFKAQKASNAAHVAITAYRYFSVSSTPTSVGDHESAALWVRSKKPFSTLKCVQQEAQQEGSRWMIQF